MDETELISADSHFLDPPDLWERWLPSKFRHRAPKLVEDGSGGQAWLYAGAAEPEPIGLAGLPGRSPDSLRPVGVRYEHVRPGVFDGVARLADQDADGIAAEVIFPTARPLAHFLDDRDQDFVLAGVDAFNGFVRDAFCAAAPTRLFPVAQLPTTGVADCVRVLKRAVDQGFVAAVLPCWPSGGDHLSAEDAGFWACAEDFGLPICVHVSLSSREERLLLRQYREQQRMPTKLAHSVRFGRLAERSPQALEFHHGLPNAGLSLGRAASVLSEFLMSGIFDVFPALRVCLVETWVGWIPRILEAVDDIWRRNHRMQGATLREEPSTYWHTNMAATFLEDRAGLALRDSIGVGNMMWSTDYPHFGTFWPHSEPVALSSMGSLAAKDRAQILSLNCRSFYNL